MQAVFPQQRQQGLPVCTPILTLLKYALALVLATAPSMVFAGDVESHCRMSGGGELSMSDIPAEDLALIYNPESYKAEFAPGEVIVGMRRGFVAPTNLAELFPGLNIVEIDDSLQQQRAARRNAMIEMKKAGTLPSSEEYLLDENNLPLHAIRIKLAPRTRESVIEAIEILKRNPCVAYAQPNFISSIYPRSQENSWLLFLRRWNMSDLTAEGLAKITLHKYKQTMEMAMAPSIVFAGNCAPHCHMSGGGELSMWNDLSAKELARIYNPETYKIEFVPGEVLVGMRRGFVAPANLAELFPGLVIVEIEDILQPVRNEIRNEMRRRVKEGGNLPPWYQSLDDEDNLPPPPRTAYRIKLAPGTRESVIEAIEILKQNPSVLFAQPNYITYPTTP
ncbi:MAG: hypothetical protein FWD51_03450 [Betaproteobacteria bacterium]|nr:hypothetical protein [Betaproteobacteria bacterium]